MHLEIVGREGELAVIDDGLAAAKCGSGGVVALEGEAGIGKSRLLEAAADRARGAGFMVAAGAGEELGQSQPFGPLVRAFGISARASDPRLTAIARNLDPRAASALVGGSSGRFVVQETIIELFDELASRQPLLLVIDDVQWVDDGTISTLAALCRRAPDLAAFVIIAARPSSRPAEQLIEVATRTGARHLDLGALDPEAVARLVADVAGAVPGDELLRLVDGARGNPFFVIELVRALREEHAIEVEDGVAEPHLTSMPPTLRQTILRRVRSLSPASLELLRGAAVLGGSFDVDDLAALLDRPTVSLHGDAVAAIELGLLEDAGPELRIRHDLIREAVYADLPEAIRVSLHRRATTVLGERGGSAVVVANHVAAGGGSGAKTVTVLRQAAAELEARDPVGALAMLERALDVSELDGAERLDVMATRVALLVAVGRLADAQEAAQTALAAHPEPDTEARLRIGLAHAMLASGFATGAVEQLEAARVVGTRDEERDALLCADTAWARLDTFDLTGSACDAETAAAWGRAHRHAAVLSSGLAIQSRLAAYRGDFDEAVRLGDQAVVAAGDDAESVRRTPHLFLGLALVNADRPGEAFRVLGEGRRRAEEAGTPWAVASYYNAFILGGFHSGEWDDAITEAEAARTLHTEAGTRSAYIQMESMLGLMWLHRADYERARDALRRAEADFARPGHDAGGIVWMLWLQALFAELDGDVTEALRLLGTAFDFAVQLDVRSVQLWYGPETVRIALAAGAREHAVTVADAVARAAHAAPTAAAQGAASLAAGLVEGDRERLLTSVASYRKTQRRLDLIYACDAAATALARDGHREEAVAMLHEALTVSEGLGAAHDERRIASHLRDLGVRRGVRGARQRPTTGLESLTPTERTVLELVAAGMPNREIAERLFISRRTVESHVGRLYAKLQVRGRVALAQLAPESSPTRGT